MADSNDLTNTLTSLSRSVRTVVLHDVNPLPSLLNALYVHSGGHVTLRCVDDDADVVFCNVPSRAIIRATATTATDILARN